MTLKIEDLAEFEGTTADMVRAWLRAKGWTLSLLHYAGCDVWSPSRVGLHVRDDKLLGELGVIAKESGLSIQSLLREINPRMRAGWPTDEELERHAFWLVGQPSIRVALRVASAEYVRTWRDRLDPEFRNIGQPVCWPCDQHGNKTRRGA